MLRQINKYHVVRESRSSQGVYNVFGKEVIQNYVLIYAAKGKITVQRKVSSLQARMVIAASMPEGTLSPERV